MVFEAMEMIDGMTQEKQEHANFLEQVENILKKTLGILKDVKCMGLL